MLPQETQEWARRLLVHEAIAGKTSESSESVAVRVCARLRPPLCALAGVAGYRSLISRALMLAKTQASCLGAVRVTEQGSLQGLREPEFYGGRNHPAEGEVILIAQLLELILTFLGTPLTLRLVQAELSPSEVNLSAGLDEHLPFETILQEADQLNSVSERLELLADQQPSVETGLLSIAGNLRNTANTLQVFALIKSNSNAVRESVLNYN